MSKKRIYAIVVAASLFTGYSAYHAQNKQELSDTLLANVEALTQDEDGIETADCYRYGSGSHASELASECDSRTSPNKMYVCPDHEMFMTRGLRGTCYKK
ncbi:MAG: NVEALA domain-containing protein [Bacteroidaceae bacterium]|nr:NVEALA domain-containing protein [Bacteroidaceae bacterium]